MKPRLDFNSRNLPRQRGIMLLETMIYLAVFFILLGLATAVYFRAMENSRALRKAADDIGRVLNAGELWREDIRRATRELNLAVGDDAVLLEIPTAPGVVTYRFTDHRVERKTSSAATWIPILRAVKQATFHLDEGREVRSWRWEIELEPSSKKARLKPLFTFEAVPGKGGAR